MKLTLKMVTIKSNDYSEAKKEAIQVGAMALRFLIDIEKLDNKMGLKR